MPRPAHQTPSIRTRTLWSTRSQCRRMARFVGGGFTTIGGQTRNNMARLDAVTGLADSFKPNSDRTVNSIVSSRTGKFRRRRFQHHRRAVAQLSARLDPATGLADAFDPNLGDDPFSIALQADGKILVCGDFFSVGGQARGGIARLDATGALDSWNPNSDGQPFSIVVQTDGSILVGGFFSTIGGQTRSNIARLDAITGLADSFNPGAGSPVRSIAVQADVDSRGRPVQHPRWTDPQPYRATRARRTARPDARSEHGWPCLRHRRSARWQDSHRRRFQHRARNSAQSYCPPQYRRHARHDF